MENNLSQLQLNDKILLYQSYREINDPKYKELLGELVLYHENLLRGTVIKNFNNINLPVDEKISICKEGLIKALNKFDATKNCKFSTYATLWIKQALFRHLEKDTLVKYPAQYNSIWIKYNKLKDKHNDEYIKKELNLSDQNLEYIKNYNSTYEYQEYDEIMDDFTQEIVDNDNFNEIKDILYKALDTLDPDERAVVELQYGFHGKKYTKKDIANRTGINHGKISQKNINKLEKSALNKLKDYFYDNIKLRDLDLF